MRRILIPAILAALLLTGAGHARLIKEMQVTRSGTVEIKTLDQATVYQLMLPNNKAIVIGDRSFFQPATQAMLDQAAQRQLTVTLTGEMLVYNHNQPPVFTLPLANIAVAGLETPQPQSPPADNAATRALSPEEAQRAQQFENARLSPQTPPLAQAMNDYPFFTARSWRLVDADNAEFRGELDPASWTVGDKHLMRKLRAKDPRDIFKSITFVAKISLSPEGKAECKNVALEAELQDGSKIQGPPKLASFFFDRIFHHHALKIDSVLAQAAENPNYGTTAAPTAQ